MVEAGRSGRRGGAPPDETAIGGGRQVAVRRLPGAARLALRLREADARALGGAFGFRLDQAINRLVTNGAMISARLGPDEWLLIGPEAEAEAIANGTAAALGDRFHSLVDIGHRNAAFEVAGAGAAGAIDAGCPLDLDAAAFPLGTATRTLLGHAEIVLMRTGDGPTFRVECWRSFADYVGGFLAEAARNVESVT